MRTRHVALVAVLSAGIAAGLVALRPPKTAPLPGTGTGVDGVQLGWTESTEVPEDRRSPPQGTGTGTGTGSAPVDTEACSPGMILVDAMRCPFAAHRCADGGLRDAPCHRWVAEVLCEGKEERLRFCIDRFEYPNLAGVRPASRISFQEAERACAAEEKRLCTAPEWSLACEGPGIWPLPTGVRRDARACAIDRARFAAASLEPAGRRATCASPFGVVDLMGGVDEWIVEPNGTAERPPHRWALAGGSTTGGRSCRDHVTDRDRAGDEATGFRCCTDAAAPRPAESPRAAEVARPDRPPLPGWTALAVPGPQ